MNTWALIDAKVGLTEGAFMDKGREDPSNWELPLSMTVLGTQRHP